jgi:predicted nucleic acid-binding protein
MIAGIAHSAACRDYCEQLVQGDSRVYFSRLLRIELLNALRNLATRHRTRLPEDLQHRFRLADWATDPEVRRDWYGFALAQFEDLLDRFAEVVELPLSAEIVEATREFMALHDLKSNDATHWATAWLHQLPLFVAADREFQQCADPPRLLVIRDP